MNVASLRPNPIGFVAHQQFSSTPTFGLLGTYPPTLCGLATFGAALADGLTANGSDVNVVRVSDGSSSVDARVIGELVNGSPSSVAAGSELLSQNNIALIQHDYGIYGGVDEAEIVEIIRGLRVPSIVVLRTVLKNPSPRQRAVLEAIASTADQVVVMSQAANERLSLGYDVDRGKISTIPHGVTIQPKPTVRRSGRPTLLTWGLLGPGKGIERVIDAMGSLRDLPGQPRYLVVGRTHPKVAAAEGEAYRDSLIEQARRLGVTGTVSFDPRYQTADSLNVLAQSSTAIVLPYDSADQVTSGVLVDAIASGRPVIATAFPHAVELLGGGAGIVVDRDDQDALVSALRRVVRDPYLAGSMAEAARQLAPTMAWTVVAKQYLHLARRLIAERSALV